MWAMAQPPYPAQPFQPAPPAPECYRHPGRQTWIACQRCGRPICPECMIPAPVGFQCPDCVAQGARDTRQHLGAYGGLRSADPTVTSVTLIGLNAAVWGLILLTGGYASVWYHRLALSPTGSCVLAADPSRYLPGTGEAACGQLTGLEWMPGVADGAWWQLLTSAFAHVDVLHIGFNMLALWFLGPGLERAIGRVRFLAVYLVSALAGSVLVLWLSDPLTTTLGASGAVFGLMGGFLVVGLKARANIQPLLFWLGINALYSFLGSGISWQGHLGGLLGGMAMAAIIAYAPKEQRARTQLAGLIGFTLVLLALVAVRVAQLA